MLHFFIYLLIRLLTFPLRFFSYSALQKLGSWAGYAAYFIFKKFRKRTLSNLALAKDLHLSGAQIQATAKRSFGSLMTTCLEYAKLAQEKDIHHIVQCLNPEKALGLLSEGKGVIFFCGHQANWELLFLEGTSRMPGVAIGRPIKNTHLYNWILSIREKFGGKIITPKQAVKEGLRALKQGKFLGIVGDQGMPDSGFYSPFLGRMAWTSPLPAILSYRSGRPILVATTYRKDGKYWIEYSDPIWPDPNRSMEEEIPRLMTSSLSHLEKSILTYPEQWLWQHNRWKQQVPGKLKKAFRQECICILLPQDPEKYQSLLSYLPLFRKFYPTEFITFYIPKGFSVPNIDAEMTFYDYKEELLVEDYRFKLVFDFTSDSKIRAHFLKLSAFDVFSWDDLVKLSGLSPQSSLSEILPQALSYAS
jgi:Kdo2-lipid IVA lauroyltransferase/acyltransferase